MTGDGWLAPAIDADQVMVHDPFTVALARHMPFITAQALPLSQGDDDLADELFQAARIRLLELGATRYAEADDPYVRSSLVGAMLHARRWELSRRFAPLTEAVREERRRERAR